MGLGIRKLIAKVNMRNERIRIAEQEQKAVRSRVASVLNKNSNFITTEAYKAARTNIIFTLSNIENNCKKVIITSASPGEGKTTTCINLAIAFAQTGSKVLLIGADLRKPRVYRHLKIERKNGISDVLCGLIKVEEAIKTCPEFGIDCITAGQIPPNPVELLSSQKMGDVLEELSQRYDYIFVDTPPVTMVADATAMSKFVDGVIVIVRQNYTIHETLEKARSNLDFAGAKILGYVLNDVNNIANRYSNYKKYGHSGYGKFLSSRKNNYGYGYGYGYGYHNSEISEQESKISDEEIDVPLVGIDEDYIAEQNPFNEDMNDEEAVEAKEGKKSDKKGKKDKKKK